MALEVQLLSSSAVAAAGCSFSLGYKSITRGESEARKSLLLRGVSASPLHRRCRDFLYYSAALPTVRSIETKAALGDHDGRHRKCSLSVSVSSDLFLFANCYSHKWR